MVVMPVNCQNCSSSLLKSISLHYPELELFPLKLWNCKIPDFQFSDFLLGEKPAQGGNLWTAAARIGDEENESLTISLFRLSRTNALKV
jgi:hypothetical protein